MLPNLNLIYPNLISLKTESTYYNNKYLCKNGTQIITQKY